MAMQKRLPAELREVVYRFLCIEDRPIPVGPYYHFREYNGPIRDHRLEPSAELLTDGVDVDSDDEEIGVEDVVIEMPDGRLKRDHTSKPPSGQSSCQKRHSTWLDCQSEVERTETVHGQSADKVEQTPSFPVTTCSTPDTWVPPSPLKPRNSTMQATSSHYAPWSKGYTTFCTCIPGTA